MQLGWKKKYKAWEQTHLVLLIFKLSSKRVVYFFRIVTDALKSNWLFYKYAEDVNWPILIAFKQKCGSKYMNIWNNYTFCAAKQILLMSILQIQWINLEKDEITRK